MHFLVSSELLSNDNVDELYDFAKRFFEDRIYLEFSDIEMAQEWVDGLEPKTRELWSRLLRQSVLLKSHHNMKKIYLPANKVRVVHNVSKSQWSGNVTLTLDDARTVLDHVIMVGLENSRNDRDFLLTVLPLRSRERLMSLFNKGRLAFIGGGGNGELKAQLLERVQNPSFRLLSWIMFDNDARYPGHLPQATEELIRVCADNDLTFHCLERRCVENYITREIYNLVFPHLQERNVEAIFGLDNNQLKFFNFKKGFSNSGEEKHPLYGNLTKQQKKALSKGFEDGLAPRVYALENRQKVHEMLCASGVIAEFGNKISHLEQLLGRPV